MRHAGFVIAVLFLVILGVAGNGAIWASDETSVPAGGVEHEKMHHAGHEVPGGMAQPEMRHAEDKRTPLGLSPSMKVHQLENMRTHLKAVHEIVRDIAVGEFDRASVTAHEKLGLTPKMKQMCEVMPGGVAFREMGMAFHKSGDELGDVLKTKDATASLKALEVTLSHCTACHDTYRQ